MPSPDLLLKNTFTAEPHQLEVYVDRKRSGEHHFYCHGLSVADFASVFRAELRDTSVLLFKISPSILNTNYWQPYSEGLDRELTEKMGGIITKKDGDKLFLWRADHIARGRHFSDALGVEPQLLPGPVFRMKGEEFVTVAGAMREAQDDIAFAVVKMDPEQDRIDEISRRSKQDSATLTLTQPEERLLYVSQSNHVARVAFSAEALLYKAVEGSLRGFCSRISKAHFSYISKHVVEQVVDFSDKVGFLAYPEKDFIDKDRSFEVMLHLGKSEWPPERVMRFGDEKLLVYYDRTSGIWAIQY